MKSIHVQLTITLDEAAATTMAELLAPAIRLAATSRAGSRDERRGPPDHGPCGATSAGEAPPGGPRLLIDSREAARLLRVSPRTLWQLSTDGEMPSPVRIGRAVRWSRAILTKWAETGCPLDPQWREREDDLWRTVESFAE